MAEVTISVLGMSEVVRGLERGIDTLRHTQSTLRSTLDRYGLDTSRTLAIGQSVTWAVDTLPGVRRRYAMAQSLEGKKSTWAPGTVVFDEALLPHGDPALATRNGKALAASLRDGDGVPDEAAIVEIQASMNDPYFASGFAGELTPEELAALVQRLSRERRPADGYLDPEAQEAANAW